MQRKCFLDHGKHKVFLSEKLDLFFFGKLKISYGVCKNCGLIFQTETINPSKLKKYYDYITIAFDNLYKPTEDKIKSVNRHIEIVKNEIKQFPSSVLEVGVFNTHNLNQFKKNGSKIVNGLEPSKKVSKTINNQEKIKIFSGNIEKHRFKTKYDLIVMSHVLEHFYNPLLVLKKCFRNQKENQHLLLEVPLFEYINDYPNGALHLEHLNYFNEENFLLMIKKAGYKTIFISKTIESTAFPFLTVVAKKISGKRNFDPDCEWFPHLKSYKNLKITNLKEKNKRNNNYLNQMQNLKNYIKRNKKLWNALEKKIDKFNKNKNIYIYGAGFHGSQLLAYTNIEKKFKINGFLDSSSSKHDKYIGKYKILDPNNKKLDFDSNIIISSIYSEENIYNSLKFLRNKGMKVYKLYN